MAVVDKVDVHAVRLPLERPVYASQSYFGVRDYVLICLKCDDGSSGIGFTYVGTTGAVPVARIITDMLLDSVLGKDPELVGEIWQAMFSKTLIQGRSGLVMNAISAVDIAIWDRNARVASKTMHVFLGAKHTESVPAYASGGYYRERLDISELKAEIETYVDAGFNSVKIKTGRLSPEEEERRVAAVRETIGSDRTLLLDAYHSWSNEETALRYIERLVKYDPAWIEDPLPPDNFEAHGALARKIAIPIATGEFYAGLPAFKELIYHKSASVLQPEAPRCGGITEWLRIVGMAAKHGLTVCPCWFHDLHAQLAPGMKNVPFVECFPTFSILNFGRLIDRPLRIDHGKLLLSHAAGLGFEFDMELIRRHEVQ